MNYYHKLMLSLCILPTVSPQDPSMSPITCCYKDIMRKVVVKTFYENYF